MCVFATAVCTVSVGQTPKPKIRVAVDGFPTGRDTPEGVAADFTRSFINTDPTLFSGSCIKPYGGEQIRDTYSKFLQGVVESMKYEAQKKLVSPRNPKKIGKVFAARHLSATGPASYGHASFGFQDVMFVDVGSFLQNGERKLTRTLVIKDRDGKWYVHPAPDMSPLLSTGLNDEKPSIQDFSEVYELQK